MNNWQDIWNRREVQAKDRPMLQDLIRLDGFDSGAGAISLEAWQAYVARRAGDMGLKVDWSVFEIGCGAGAFLLPLRERGCKVGGVDYSAALIAAAEEAMPEGHWQVGSADQSFGEDIVYDAFVANSVFQYFPDEDYAGKVVATMARVARHAVAILDVPDARLAAQAEAARRQAAGEETYKQRYAGLHHLVLLPDWFRTKVPAGWQVRVTPQDIAEYGNSPYRFNVIMTSND